jgi:hypothetical protein
VTHGRDRADALGRVLVTERRPSDENLDSALRMASEETAIVIYGAPAYAWSVCQGAVRESGWTVNQASDWRLMCTEPWSAQLLMTSNPARIEIALYSVPEGCLASIQASNFGVGPIASGHVSSQMARFVVPHGFERRSRREAPSRCKLSIAIGQSSSGASNHGTRSANRNVASTAPRGQLLASAETVLTCAIGMIIV